MRRLLQTAYLILLALSIVVVAVSAPKGIDIDLFSMVGDDGGVLSALARKTSSVIRVMPLSIEAEAHCREADVFGGEIEPAQMIRLVRERGKGLLSRKHRQLLAAGETNKIARAAFRRDFTGLGLFTKAEDPYYFLNDFVMELAAMKPEDTILVGEVGPQDEKALVRLLELARAGEVYLSGAPFHSYLATESSKREINLLGAISLVAVFVLGWMLFRSFRFALPMFLALACGFAFGAAVVMLLPMRPHVLTFLFGTSLVGLGVDYCYHGMMSGGTSAKDIVSALATTCLSFSPLLFSSLPILNQMAAFTISGLVAICSFVMLWCVRSR